MRKNCLKILPNTILTPISCRKTDIFSTTVNDTSTNYIEEKNVIIPWNNHSPDEPNPVDIPIFTFKRRNFRGRLKIVLEFSEDAFPMLKETCLPSLPFQSRVNTRYLSQLKTPPTFMERQSPWLISRIHDLLFSQPPMTISNGSISGVRIAKWASLHALTLNVRVVEPLAGILYSSKYWYLYSFVVEIFVVLCTELTAATAWIKRVYSVKLRGFGYSSNWRVFYYYIYHFN